MPLVSVCVCYVCTQGADLGALESDSDEEGPRPEVPTLEATRTRMHALLDEVFSLATHPRTGPQGQNRSVCLCLFIQWPGH